MSRTVLLKSFDSYDQLAELDLTNLSQRVLSRSRDFPGRSPVINGVFGQIGVKSVRLFRDGTADLVLVVDDQRIATSGIANVEIQRSGQRAVFSLRLVDGAMLSIDYSIPEEVHRLATDPTAFVEAEDFDFALFLRNVLTNESRKA